MVDEKIKREEGIGLEKGDLANSWISVNNALPENYYRVLCVDVKGALWDAVFIAKATQTYKEPGFYAVDGMNIFHLHLVTHWMHPVVPSADERKAVVTEYGDNWRLINGGMVMETIKDID